jgi:acyl-CoA thioesterase-1
MRDLAARFQMRARRRWLAAIAGACALVASGARAAGGSVAGSTAVRLCTFGDSVLDCGHYNDRGLDPGRLLVRNDDALFPEFRGKDLRARGAAELEHRAVDGAVAADLARQAGGLEPRDASVAIVSVGGNDLLRGLAADSGAGLLAFEATLDRFLRALPIRPVVLATVYDPTFGDDTRNFLGVPARIARANHRRVNGIIRALAERHGRLADVHAHFLTGDPSWFTHTIEPSLVGASEVRRVFLAEL